MLEAVVVLPAGGCGTRLGSTTPKQFLEVLGKPIICYTIEAFMCIPWVKRIIVPIPENWRQKAILLKKKYDFDKVAFVQGKETRHRSIYSGIQSLSSCQASDIIIVHDAVRPFLKEDFLKEICLAAQQHQASGAVRGLVSTIIKSSEDGFLINSLVRTEHRESHTPQAFHYSIINKAYEMCSEEDFEHGTECLNLVRKYCGVSAKLVDGPEYLWKVTHQKDLILMENYIKTGKT